MRETMKNSNLDMKVAQHFDSIAANYGDNYTNNSFIAYFLNQRLKIVFEFLKNYDRATVLDIGCGSGIMAQYCTDKNCEFFGIDISKEMIDTCIDKFDGINSTHFSVGKVQSLEFPDSSFNVVLCMGILEYIELDEIDIAFSEILRVLKPDGLVVFSLMNDRSFFTWNRRIKNYIVKKIFGRDCKNESYDGLSKAFDENSVLNLLNYHRLTDVEVVFFCLNILPSFLEPRLPDKFKIFLSKGLEKIIKDRFKWLYMAFILKGKKTEISHLK
jgi:ubiquinone/menaquinone biosynthesis C-methylase UbiE